MANPIGISTRALTEDEIQQIRNICDKQKFSYGTFCGLIVRDVIHSQELTEKYIQITRQFEEDQKPASIEEVKALREKLRQQEEKLVALRQFKLAAQDGMLSDSLSR